MNILAGAKKECTPFKHEPNTLRDAAIELAKQGFHVFPLKVGEKRPATSNGFYDATNDADQIKKWWTANPNYNIGVRTGTIHKGKLLVVVDIDPRNGGDEAYAKLTAKHGASPSTVEVMSGRGDGGRHRYLWVSADAKLAGGIAGYPGIDIKSKGGYIVAAPSIHPVSGMPYEWDDLITSSHIDGIQDAPEWLVQAINDGKRVTDVEFNEARILAPEQLDETLSDLQGALSVIPCEDRDEWVNLGMALKSLGDAAKPLFMEWSSKYSKWDATIEKDALEKWEGFYPSRIGIESVFWAAQQLGWDNPRRHRNAVCDVTDFDVITDLTSLLTSFDYSDGVFDDLHHYVDKWIPHNEVTLLAGHGGGGKSYASLVMAVHVVLGLPIGELKTQRARVLFFSAEDSGRVLNQRLARICKVMGIDRRVLEGELLLLDASDIDPALHRAKVRGSTTSTTALLTELSELVESHNIGLTIIDNASDTFDDDEIGRAAVRAFIRSLRTHLARPDRAVLLLTHVNKASASGGRNGASNEDYSGSTAWHNSVRSRLSLEQKNGEIVISHMKANQGALALPVSFVWSSGAPLPRGAITAASEAQQKELAIVKDTADKAALLAIVKDFTERGANLSTSDKGPYSTHRSIEMEGGFPEFCDSSRTIKLFRELEREGHIVRQMVKTSNRKEREIYEYNLSYK
ncbi:hypothetical protein BH11PSE12_BH11PSE12_02140 [soil metagenome]